MPGHRVPGGDERGCTFHAPASVRSCPVTVTSRHCTVQAKDMISIYVFGGLEGKARRETGCVGPCPPNKSGTPWRLWGRAARRQDRPGRLAAPRASGFVSRTSVWCSCCCNETARRIAGGGVPDMSDVPRLRAAQAGACAPCAQPADLAQETERVLCRDLLRRSNGRCEPGWPHRPSDRDAVFSIHQGRRPLRRVPPRAACVAPLRHQQTFPSVRRLAARSSW